MNISRNINDIKTFKSLKAQESYYQMMDQYTKVALIKDNFMAKV